MFSILGIILTILVVAVILWGGDRLLALWPGNEKLKQLIRIIVIVAVAIWCLFLIAGFFGIVMPWNGEIPRHRR